MRSFDPVAVEHERGRPGYPDQVFDALEPLTGELVLEGAPGQGSQRPSFRGGARIVPFDVGIGALLRARANDAAAVERTRAPDYPGIVDELTRAFEFERRWFERRSTRLERFGFGVAYLDEEYRQRYYSNFLLADERLDDASAQALIEAGERILGGAGYDHRLVIVRDERWAERFAPAFDALGFPTSREVTMAHRRDPDRDAGLPVEEVPFAVVRPLIQQMYREDPDVPEDVVLLFAEQHGKYERVAGARFFAARVDGRLAGNCELYQEGDEAQVENVSTLQQFCGRGVARSVILQAVRAARESGAHHVFIVTDEEDWPRHLYARLGFDQIGRTWEFLRFPTAAEA